MGGSKRLVARAKESSVAWQRHVLVNVHVLAGKKSKIIKQAQEGTRSVACKFIYFRDGSASSLQGLMAFAPLS